MRHIGKSSSNHSLERNRNEVKIRIHFLLQSKENDDHILQEGSAAEERLMKGGGGDGYTAHESKTESDPRTCGG